jgi:ribosomal-protein-alanine N-acetyltransferase
MKDLKIRHQLVKDATDFFRILKNPNFIYFLVNVNSIAEEKIALRKNTERRKNNESWNYTFLYKNKIVGGGGIRINRTRPYIGELGYFLDENYWGRGLTTAFVKLMEQEGFDKLGLTRIEILMRPENKASEKVAIKNGYKKEGRLKKMVRDREGRMHDAFIYAKVL